MKQLSRADAELLSDLRQADEKLGRLPEAMLEKDVFITEATLTLAQLSSPEISVIFCGGTSLSKAHHLIERMSEDVDFKLAIRVPDLSKNARRTMLKSFRTRALEVLKDMGYEFSDEHIVSRDSHSYISIKLPYATQFTAHAAIRPHVQIEFNSSVPRVPTRICTIQTHISEKLKLSRSGALDCLDISETMAEKLVSFTRRTAQFLAGKHRGEFDTAIVRHLYDVYQLSKSGIADVTVVAELSGAISTDDGTQYARQNPEYADNPIRETKRALDALTSDRRFEQWYEDFVNAMIYGDDRPRFRDVAATFKDAVYHALKIAT